MIPGARHETATDPLREQAALYALGALERDEAREFEVHLAEGCATCEAEVRSMGKVVADLGHAVAPVAPGPLARERLLGRVRADARVAGAALVRSGDSDFAPGPLPGVAARLLHRDPDARRFTALVRVAPGASYPVHTHADTEELYVLAGELHLGEIRLRAGDFCAGMPGSRHAASVSPAGCTFVVHASEADRLGGDAPGSAEGILVVHADDRPWQPGTTPGVSYRVLREDVGQGTRTALVRMAPGAVIPGNRHVIGQVYVLEGDGQVAGEALSPGDYYRLPGGTVQRPSTTRRGCTFLLMSARDEILS